MGLNIKIFKIKMDLAEDCFKGFYNPCKLQLKFGCYLHPFRNSGFKY